MGRRVGIGVNGAGRILGHAGLGAHDGIDPLPADDTEITDLLAYRSSLKRYFGRAIGDDEAEDYVQEVFARVCASAREEKIRNPGSFLRGIASNLLKERYRRRNTLSRRGGHVPIEEAGALAAPETNSPERILAARQSLARIENVILSMSPIRRKIFALVRFDGKTYREVAEIAGISEAAVWYHLDRAVAILAEAEIEL
ncbi:MAG: polymerase sigma factor [Rhodospirillales bacterium]|nr:polymerase sigma factor [Rhodospirillales bacterium]